MDGNVTTLIAALVLWFLGTGTVKGFAQTLALGIALSMFTALVVTRIILNAFFAIGIKDIKFYGIAKPVKKIDFLSKKALYFGVSIALIVFGIAFLIIEEKNKGKKAKIRKISQITYKTAALIGVFQLIAAIFPGTSRSGATIVGALLIGVSRTVAAEFTFFLAIPVMLGASLLKVLKFGFAFRGFELGILFTGMIVAFVVSVIVIKFLMDYIKKNDFKVFGWYRIILGVLVLVYFGIIA